MPKWHRNILKNVLPLTIKLCVALICCSNKSTATSYCFWIMLYQLALIWTNWPHFISLCTLRSNYPAVTSFITSFAMCMICNLSFPIMYAVIELISTGILNDKNTAFLFFFSPCFYVTWALLWISCYGRLWNAWNLAELHMCTTWWPSNLLIPLFACLINIYKGSCTAVSTR